MMHASGRVLRKRFLTKEEKDAWRKVEEKRKREAKVKAIRESMVQKAKAKKERELKKRRAKACMEANLQGCQPKFRYIVKQWAKDKTVAHVNKFFRLLDEFKCPMGSSCDYTIETARLLRLNNCGYEELLRGTYLYDFVDCSDWEWETVYRKQCDRANELERILYQMC